MCLFICQGHGDDVTGRVAHWPSMCPLGHVCVRLYVWDVCRDRDHIVFLLLLDILRGRKEWEGGERKRGGGLGLVGLLSLGSDAPKHPRSLI